MEEGDTEGDYCACEYCENIVPLFNIVDECSCESVKCHVKLFKTKQICNVCYMDRIKKCEKCGRLNCIHGIKRFQEGYMKTTFYCLNCAEKFLGECKICRSLTRTKYHFRNGTFFLCTLHTPRYMNTSLYPLDDTTNEITINCCFYISILPKNKVFICERERCGTLICPNCAFTKGRRRFDSTAPIICLKCIPEHIVAEMEKFYIFRKAYVKHEMSEVAWRFVSPYF